MRKISKIIAPLLLLFALSLNACVSVSEVIPTELSPTTFPTAYPSTYMVSVPPYITDTMVDGLDAISAIEISNSINGSNIQIDVSAEDPIIEWVYVLAAPFSYIGDNVKSTDLQAFWQGKEEVNFPAEAIFTDGSTKAVIEKIWGSASPANVRVIASEELLNRAWADGNVLAIFPFEQLEPRWKVLGIDGISPIHKDFNPSEYVLNIPFSLLGGQTELRGLRLLITEEKDNGVRFPLTNWRADRLTTVVITGMTALMRGTAYMMETRGYTYPAIDIGDILRDADILHINNEIPFVENCPSPFVNKANDANSIFCSKPEYIQLLEAVGTDVVELTGDYFRDWDPGVMLNTIEMYKDHHWQYYGGGRNYTDGIQPAVFNHNGNKIAFFGCNAKLHGYATADESSPGAVHCDLDLMAKQIANAVDQGYLPIFTFQHPEDYTYGAKPSLRVDFHFAADAGAVIVSGSQAHQPHAMEFYKSSFLHYGLGNLFFDQYNEGLPQRQAFIDRHVFYDGKYISTELITIMFIDLARPRLMTEQERVNLLDIVFAASGWQ
ncbi:MAG: CapA family protein [Anaerolineaceae bacterium]|nr:CapA family protein [Anaerolineaceae bacterium]